MKCYHDMLDQIPPKRILWSWNQWESHCLHRRPHIWNSRTSGASRHQNTRELPLEQKVNLHQIGDPIKTYRPVQVRVYIVCVKLAFKHTTWTTMLSPCKRWRHSDAVRLTASGSRKKMARALSPPGVGATAILATKITWWHGNADYDCSRFKL